MQGGWSLPVLCAAIVGDAQFDQLHSQSNDYCLLNALEESLELKEEGRDVRQHARTTPSLPHVPPTGPGG